MSEGTKVTLLIGDGTVAVYENVSNWVSSPGELEFDSADGVRVISSCKYIIEEPPEDNAGTTS